MKRFSSLLGLLLICIQGSMASAASMQNDFLVSSSGGHITIRFEDGLDVVELVYPVDPADPILVIANHWQFRLSSEFLGNYWSKQMISQEDAEALREFQERLLEPSRTLRALEQRIQRFALGSIERDELDPCGELVQGSLFGAYGIGVITCAVGCGASFTGIGGVVCAGCIVGVVGGAAGFAVSFRACDGGEGSGGDPTDCPEGTHPGPTTECNGQSPCCCDDEEPDQCSHPGGQESP